MSECVCLCVCVRERESTHIHTFEPYFEVESAGFESLLKEEVEGDGGVDTSREENGDFVGGEVGGLEGEAGVEVKDGGGRGGALWLWLCCCWW